jgi:hypothetical protein
VENPTLTKALWIVAQSNDLQALDQLMKHRHSARNADSDERLLRSTIVSFFKHAPSQPEFGTAVASLRL